MLPQGWTNLKQDIKSRLHHQRASSGKLPTMTGTIDTFTLISLIVLLVIVFKLRSVLGRHSSDDEARIKARNEERERAAAAMKSSEKVITLPRRSRDETPAAAEPAAQGATQAEAEERINAMAGADTAVRRGLLEILGADRSFDPEQFLKGARSAYEMIVTAYAEGDRETLRGLLANDVFDDFNTLIADRERRGEKVEQKFVGINKADILEAEFKSGAAEITVRFVSQLITATHDKAGQIIDGDLGRVKDLTDIFTFRRDISTAKARQNPEWWLIETSSSN
jgi:predicted lipid-binding transport protein (Tim44 family)